MNPLDALWHVLGLLAPILVTGCLTALMAKLIWRHELASTKLAAVCASAAAGGGFGLGTAAALVGRDGQMAAYGAMALGCACGTWYHLLRSRFS